MRTLYLDPNEIKKCVADTFSGNDFENDENYFLETLQMQWNNYGHHLYPSMVINGKTFRGRISPDNVFEAICASFESEPVECRQWQQYEGIPIPEGQSTGINQRTLFMFIIALVIINGIIILIYRRYLQKEMEADMKI